MHPAPQQLSLEQERSCWPDQVQSLLQGTQSDDLIRTAVLLQRRGEFCAAESNLLATLQSEPPLQQVLVLDLLAGLQQRRGDQPRARRLLEQAERLLSRTETQDASQRAPLVASLRLRRRQLDSLPEQAEPPDQQIHSPLEWLQRFQEQIIRGDLEGLNASLQAWPADADGPDALELKSIALRRLGRQQDAMQLIDQLLHRGSTSSNAWIQALHLNQAAGRYNGLAITMASRQHPHHAEIAHLRNAVQLMERQTAAGRRSAFQERLQYSLGIRNTHPGESDSNLLNAYDQTGCSHLMPFMHPSAWRALQTNPKLCSNLVMQLASQTHPRAVEACERLAASYPPPQPLPASLPHHPLRVALVSPDLAYHPVGRFVQMLLEAGLSDGGDLYVVDTSGQAMGRTRDLAQEKLINLSQCPAHEQVGLLRRLNLDVAVDLSGWTADHNAHLFCARIAPVQVNYLGYYASSGLEAMDVWLGDQALFPSPMQEWHSERIVRLPRPFLAWTPTPHLAEGTVAVPPGPSGAVTFGCFNHVRKLSSATLSLWSELLRSTPGSRLALKAFASDDPGVTALLERRMHQCGLQPEQVIWLPTTARPEDHLRQYGLIDIGLDPFPNGGCTTTCEALWMGVPVVTLRGSHYVERMSTAVLDAAGLPQWIAESQEAYLTKARQAANQVHELRRQRKALRAQLQQSPLGDAQGLAKALWSCWGELRQSLAA